MPDPATGGVLPLRSVETKLDSNHWRVEMFVTGPEGEFKQMELNYSRM